MNHPFPIDILEVTFFARADKTDWGHIGFLAAVENELAPSARCVEVLPAHQSSATCRPAIDYCGLDLLTDEIRRENRGNDVAWESAGFAVTQRRRSQRQDFCVVQAALRLEQLLQAHREPRLGNRCKRIAFHLPKLQTANDDRTCWKVDHCSRTKGGNHLA
jgi:hypothetical protein